MIRNGSVFTGDDGRKPKEYSSKNSISGWTTKRGRGGIKLAAAEGRKGTTKFWVLVKREEKGRERARVAR